MSNIVVRENIAWLYFAKCYPKNLIQFPLKLYLYIGQTLRPDDRPEEHMTEDKSNWKFDLLRSLTCADDWFFLFVPVIREENESFKNYMNRTGIIEKQVIRDCQTNYLKHGIDSHGLNATDGGEHPANGGIKTSIPGETTGVKYLQYSTRHEGYQYCRHIWQNNEYMGAKCYYTNKNPFLVFLYMEANGEKDFIVDKKIFLNNVWQYWTKDVYNYYCTDNIGIKSVHVRVKKTTKRGYEIVYQKKGKNTRSRTLFSSFLELFQDGILPIENIINLDFYVWNAKLILEGKFDIKNGRPDAFYYDFFDFRKIHHFTVDNLEEAINFLKEIEVMTDISVPVGQQRLQCT